MATKKELRRLKIKRRIRKKVSGSSVRPRLSVFRSNKFIYAQLIDDLNGVTLASASSKKLGLTSNNIEAATQVGKTLAEQAKENGISDVIFDRNGYLYHGRVKALADAARNEGLNF